MSGRLTSSAFRTEIHERDHEATIHYTSLQPVEAGGREALEHEAANDKASIRPSTRT